MTREGKAISGEDLPNGLPLTRADPRSGDWSAGLLVSELFVKFKLCEDFGGVAVAECLSSEALRHRRCNA
jgi:hypothetical protein